jgi:hypothetical protein
MEPESEGGQLTGVQDITPESHSTRLLIQDHFGENRWDKICYHRFAFSVLVNKNEVGY